MIKRSGVCAVMVAPFWTWLRPHKCHHRHRIGERERFLDLLRKILAALKLSNINIEPFSQIAAFITLRSN